MKAKIEKLEKSEKELKVMKVTVENLEKNSHNVKELKEKIKNDLKGKKMKQAPSKESNKLIKEQAQKLKEGRQEEVEGDEECPYCDKKFKDMKTLGNHCVKEHRSDDSDDEEESW